MRKLLPIIGTAIFAAFSIGSQAQVLVTNNGAVANIMPGCVVSIKTSSVHNQSGEINNAGRVTIEGDYVNDDITTGGGGLGVFNVEGDWENNGTFTSDQSEVNLYGTNQQITGSSVTSFYDLTLNGTGIKSQTIDAQTTNDLSLNDAELATNGNKMTVTNADPNAISFNTGFVSSTGSGRLERATNSTSAYFFPVGSSTGTPRYRPVELTPVATNSNIFGVRMANVDATGEGFDRSVNLDLCDINANFYHQIDRSSGSDAADVKLFFDASLDGNWTINAHWQNTPQWESMGTPVTGTSGSFTTLTTQAWNDFSYPAFGFAIPGPSVSFSGLEPSYCTGSSSVNLTGTPSGGVFSGQGVTNNTFNPNGLNVGSYTVTYTYTTPEGCVATDQQQVEITSGPSPTITADGPLTVCAGDTVVLDAGSGYNSYSWVPGGQQTQTISVYSPGIYSVNVVDNNGCSGTSSNSLFVEVLSPIFAVITANGNTLYASPANEDAYQWYFNGVPIPGATGTSHVALQSGNYQVEITDATTGCSDISSIVEFTPGNPDGIDENSALQDLALYPNPGSGQFMLTASLNKFTKVTVSITNTLGQKLRPDTEVYTDEMQMVYDLEDMANGVYFVRVTIDNNEQRTIRYIKN